MAPITLNLIDPGSKPLHALPYTVPRSVEQQLRKEVALESLKKILLLNGHPQHLQWPRRMEL
jgi:hypothetical protein